MKHLLCTLIAFLTLVPTTLRAEGNVIIFLHNAWFETNKDGKAHTKFGAYDFEGIKQALAKGGKVIAPKRGPDADPETEATAVTKQIEDLLASGQPPDSIKVIGASKGAFIAQIASAKLKNPKVRWVLVGGCSAARKDQNTTPKMTGHVLSIHDVTDTVASFCARNLTLTGGAEIFKEVIISTGKNHGFQFTPDEAWINPALAWK
ncbi:MAG: hypothetical protein AAFR75_10925 [Pseudomonadota bacterium]